MARKKKKPESTPTSKSSFHEGLEGFDIRVNTFGEMESTFEIDKLNDFLNKQVADKKLDQPDKPKEEKE